MENRYLFKGKRKDNGKWVFGDLVHSVYKIGDTCVGQYGNEVGMHEVDPGTICQCTGLKDKNGKLIWENDICDRKEKYPEIVKYNEGDWTLDYSYSKSKKNGYCYCNLGFYAERKCVEVIGNRFDNPELLEKENREDSCGRK